MCTISFVVSYVPDRPRQNDLGIGFLPTKTGQRCVSNHGLGGALRLVVQLALIALLPMLSWAQGTYSTNFAGTENPISEGGRWINGGVAGLDWANVRTTPGLAFGTQTGLIEYNDAAALLSGNWGPDQTVQATVHSTNQNDGIFEEVELRLRSSLSAHNATGYEITFRCSKTANAYAGIARWNGALGDFTALVGGNGSQYGVADGDVVKASMIGNVITVYLNGVQIFQTTDNTFSSGSPGIGFDLWLNHNAGSQNTNADFGFTSYSATDGTSGSPSFSLSASPATQTVAAGSSAVYTVTVTPSGGFTGAVNLSATGQPSGATVSFNPTSVTTSGTSTLTVIPSSSTPANSYPLTISGTSGALTQTASATLGVTTSGGGSTGTSCDLNKDGSTNVVDVQLAVNKYLSCTSGSNVSSQSFVSQVITGALGGSCSPTAGANTVMLSWTASITPGVSYNVYRATTSGGYTTPLNSSPISSTSFADCTVLAGQTYYYVIRSVDSNGNLSANSAETVAQIPAS